MHFTDHRRPAFLPQTAPPLLKPEGPTISTSLQKGHLPKQKARVISARDKWHTERKLRLQRRRTKPSLVDGPSSLVVSSSWSGMWSVGQISSENILSSSCRDFDWAGACQEHGTRQCLTSTANLIEDDPVRHMQRQQTAQRIAYISRPYHIRGQNLPSGSKSGGLGGFVP